MSDVGGPGPPPIDSDPAAEPTADAVPFTIVDALVLLGWLFAAQVLTASVIFAAGADLEEPLNLGLFMVVTYTVAALGGLGWLARRGRLSWEALGVRRPRWRDLFGGVGLAVGAYLTMIAALALISAVAGVPEPPEDPSLDAVRAGVLPALLVVLGGVVGAPIVEEFVFRGVLFQALRVRRGLALAVIVSSALFAAIHFIPLAFTVMFALFGVWLALGFHRTRSLHVPIVAHASFNLFVLVLALAEV